MKKLNKIALNKVDVNQSFILKKKRIKTYNGRVSIYLLDEKRIR